MTTPPRKIKVLSIDDSAVIRQVLSQIINSQPDMVSVGSAPDPELARDMIRRAQPDVLTLDIEMPKMNGLEFLEMLMQSKPMPVIMVSSLTKQGASETLRAMELGAIDFVQKPTINIREGMLNYSREIVTKIRIASTAKLRRLPVPEGKPLRMDEPTPAAHGVKEQSIIALGASTGGTEALREILVRMPTNCPPIVIAQHMPPMFTRQFAARLDSNCEIRVKEAQDAEIAQPGCAYIAPGDFHLTVKAIRGGYVLHLNQDEPVNRHRPSVDVLFNHVARQAGGQAVAALLTGMGRDGAAGLLEIHRAGGWTIAQDESTSVVFGMPREAILMGAANEISGLPDIADRILSHIAKAARQPRHSD